MTRPLRSTTITAASLRRYYGAVRPSPAHQYFRPCGGSRLCLFPWHRRLGSHVPYKSLVKLRAIYMPDVAENEFLLHMTSEGSVEEDRLAWFDGRAALLWIDQEKGDYGMD
jgi:hypothetical protein